MQIITTFSPLLLGLLFVVLSGCQSWPLSQQTDFSWYQWADPSTHNSAVQLNQRLQFTQGNTQVDLPLAVSIEAGRFSLVAFSPIGGALLNASLQQGSIQSKTAPMLPKGLTAESLMREMQMALWPIEALLEANDDRLLNIEQTAQLRIIYYHSKPLIRIRYDKGRPDSIGNTLYLENMANGYQWAIQTLKIEHLTETHHGQPEPRLP